MIKIEIDGNCKDLNSWDLINFKLPSFQLAILLNLFSSNEQPTIHSLEQIKLNNTLGLTGAVCDIRVFMKICNNNIICFTGKSIR